jgi:hypothetical protein
MTRHRSRGILAATASALLLGIVAAGCARNGPADDAGSAGPSGQTEPASAAVALETAGPAATTGATPDVAPGEPAAATLPEPAPTSSSTSAPLATPDLTEIEQLLDDLDAVLGADATADTDEGSAN